MLSIVIASQVKDSLVHTLRGLKSQKYDELIIELRGNSPATARNLGWKQTSGDLVLFIDDDIILSPNFIDEGLKYFAETSVDFAQSKIIGEQNNSKNKFIGTAMWFKREVLENLDGFDESYPFFNEDLDMYLRAKKAAYVCGFIENSVAWHPLKGGYEKLIEGNKILRKKHPKFYIELKKELR
jgi:GT2 family glycosyltransferase